MPITCATQPSADNPSAATNTTMALDPDTGGDLAASVGEVQSCTDWDLVWTGPNPAVPVQVPDFPKDTRPLGFRSGHSHIA